ncbi:DUF3857 domain-containing protein [Chitinophaga sp. Mgbs1]|uniref:DUF3857 domain-containing protein n=1 Tax=Chitinophaga solisilvae TaxID=1233460 RepID=A0A9Q5D722_9BACT|nr:DUF3857 domain-containing protein [Chitinophaga solisilvae]
MKYRPVLLIVLLMALVPLVTFAQDGSKIKFGKISKEDFKVQLPEKDSGAHALVIAEIGSSEFETDADGFRLVYKVHRRIKILDKNAYDLATIRIGLYKEGSDEERIQGLKGISYNLENGEVVETKMESSNIFTDKQDKNHVYKKFALPAVKEGTIIEYTFSILSPYYRNLRSWDFQGTYPRLWSEYKVSVPEYFDYVQIPQGYGKFFIEEKKVGRTNMTFLSRNGAGPSQMGTATPTVYNWRWVMKDVPALKEEDFITTLDNYVRRIEFQLSAINYPNEPSKPIRTTWNALMTALQKDENFSEAINNHNGFLADVTDNLVKNAKTDTEKAMAIYRWVRDNYTCNEHGSMWASHSLKSVFNTKNGNVAEINLLLIAMLKRAKLEAYPVILSTRDNGLVYPYYPLLTRFNYTLASVVLDSAITSLDASDPLLGFGKLHPGCYNGDGRMVNADAYIIPYAADSLREQKFTSVSLGKLEKGEWKGSFQQRPTYFESYGIREKVKEKGPKEFFKNYQQKFSAWDMEMQNENINDLKELESPVMVQFEFTLKPGEEDVLYLNPLFSEITKQNIFKSAERNFPVEMPAVFDEVYSFNMEVPDGYEVDEIPKSGIVKFNEDEGVFEYLIQHSGNMIQMRCRVRLTKATFAPEDYTDLRSFFDIVVNKQAEQIVLKKKK